MYEFIIFCVCATIVLSKIFVDIYRENNIGHELHKQGYFPERENELQMLSLSELQQEYSKYFAEETFLSLSKNTAFARHMAITKISKIEGWKRQVTILGE